MDGTTEPIIAVIGHPIAGNPTQFALETGLEAGGVDCRVFSVDLSPEKIEPALTGMLAMNFVAVWVASSCRPAIQQATAGFDSDVDSLVRIPPPEATGEPPAVSGWYSQSLMQKITADLIRKASQKSDLRKIIFVNEGIEPQQLIAEGDADPIQQRLNWLNHQHESNRITLEETELVLLHQAPIASQIATFQQDLDENQSWLLVIEQLHGKNAADRIDFEVPAGHTLIDLNQDCDSQYVVALDRLKASSPGDVIRCVDLHARCLSELVAQLFGKTVAVEVFQEAIDEYLAV